jgi:DNA-binding NtrC family response regulator
MVDSPAPAPDGMVRYHGALLRVAWVRVIEDVLRRLAETRTIVVIRGEPGTGRDTLARAIHAASGRGEHPFVKVRCDHGSPAGLTAELFGHEREAFPDARRRRLGKLEFAHRGTLLLDQLDSLPEAVQPLLLAVIRDRSTCRVGSVERIPVDVQIIATTRQVLQGSGCAKALYGDRHALKIVDIELPPLRARRDEIAGLAAAFVAYYNEVYGENRSLGRKAVALLNSYEWPGNVQELNGVIRNYVRVGHDELVRHMRGASTLTRAVDVAGA